LGGGINARAGRVQRLTFDDMVAPRRLIRVSYGSIEGDNDYAMLVWWFLSEGLYYRRRNRGRGVGVVQMVEEANRLFDNESRQGYRIAKSLGRSMREGRSLAYSVWMSLQDASKVPSEVLNNVNTHIVMRQNNSDVAKAATQMMPKEFAQQAMRLSTGQAIVQMHEAKAAVLCTMAPSPFELMRPDNT
jgi:DNA helicase HerA-like ATPase